MDDTHIPVLDRLCFEFTIEVYSTLPLLRNRLLGTAALDFRQFLADF